jgi:hypothetical protein
LILSGALSTIDSGARAGNGGAVTELYLITIETHSGGHLGLTRL